MKNFHVQRFLKYRSAERIKAMKRTFYEPKEQLPQVKRGIITLDVAVNAMCRGIFLGK
jgi:hypothetical protein